MLLKIFFLFLIYVVYLAVPALSCSTWDLHSFIRHMGPLVAVRGILFPDQGSSPGLLHWEWGVLAPGPPGKSLSSVLRNESVWWKCMAVRLPVSFRAQAPGQQAGGLKSAVEVYSPPKSAVTAGQDMCC